jgi:hypothetical protein
VDGVGVLSLAQDELVVHIVAIFANELAGGEELRSKGTNFGGLGRHGESRSTVQSFLACHTHQIKWKVAGESQTAPTTPLRHGTAHWQKINYSIEREYCFFRIVDSD